MAETDNIELTKPTVGSTGWGAALNTNFDTIDKYLTPVVNAEPITLGTYDDDFSETSLNAKWTVFDGTGMTTTFQYGGITLEREAASTGFDGIYQAVPAGDFTIIAKVRFAPMRTYNECVGGIALLEGLTSGDTKWVLGDDGEDGDGSRLESTTDGTIVTEEQYYYGNAIGYYRFIKSGTSWGIDCSVDGICWTSVAYEADGLISELGTIAYIGLGIIGSTLDVGVLTMHADWFLITED